MRNVLWNNPYVSLGAWDSGRLIANALENKLEGICNFLQRVEVPHAALNVNVLDDQSDSVQKNIELHNKGESIGFPGVVINYSIPEFFIRGTKASCCLTFYDHPFIRDETVRKSIDSQDHIWSCSDWASNGLSKILNRPVKNIPLAFNHHLFTDYQLIESDVFRFLHVGFPVFRKNHMDVVEVFSSLFGNNPKYELILKSYGAWPNRFTQDLDNKLIKKSIDIISQTSNIRIVNGFIPDGHLDEIMSNVHCVIGSSFAESWGLVPFNSLGKGIPTICINASGMSEFAYMGIPVVGEQLDTQVRGPLAGVESYRIKKEALCEAMMFVSENYESATNRACSNSKKIKDNYSVMNIASLYQDEIMLTL